MIVRCPECFSKNVNQFRTPTGSIWCNDCGHRVEQKELDKSFFTEDFKKIPINIWNDYYDDGHVPEGEIQSTYIYVEARISIDDSKKYLEKLLDFMRKKITLGENTKLKMVYNDQMKRWQIDVENLTHERRESILKELRILKLSYGETSYDFYSGS
jgi:uncharacterized Zn finger protein (UPF0148 family)